MRRKPQTYALTAVAYDRRHIFQRSALAELLIATLFRYRDSGRFQVHGFVVMPNHIHVLLTPAPDQTIERCAQFTKGGFSFAARKEFAGEIWQESYHAHRVTDEADLHNQLRYITENPQRAQLTDYPHIHTTSPHKLDPLPEI